MNNFGINGSNILCIQPVNNGFIVTLPFQEPQENPYEPYVKAIKDVMSDPTLKTSEPDYRTLNVHVFDTWEKVLAFLAKLG